MTVRAAIAATNDKCYLFSGNRYARYNSVTGAHEGDADLAAWRGLQSSPDAAVHWGYHKVYFFAGSKYYRYDLASDAVDDGYPLAIADQWPGIWADGVDAAVNWGSGKVYLFRGGDYIRYDISADRADPGYPRPIAGNWPGIWPDGVDAVLYQGGAKAYFFRGEEYRQYDLAADTVDAAGAVAGLRLEPVPSGAVTASRHLTSRQANGLMADLIRRGLLGLKSWTPFVDGPGGIVSPGPDVRVAVEPNTIAGIRFTNQLNPTVNWFDNVDQRMLVALYRLARWLNSSRPDVTEILHLGIGHGGGPPNDCHNQGRGLDLSGIVGEDDGTPFRREIRRDWGDLPAHGGGVRLDPETDPLGHRLFIHAYTFGAFDCESNGIGPKNHWPPPPIGGSGYVIYPDYGGDPALRKAHQDHIHMQIGPTRS